MSNKKQSILLASVIFIFVAGVFAAPFFLKKYETDKELAYWQTLADELENGQALLDQIKERRTQLTDGDPSNDMVAYNFIAASAGNLGDKQAAIKYYNKALALDPESRMALNNVADAYSDLADWDGARQAYEQHIAVDPHYVPAYRKLGYLLRDRFDDPEADIKMLFDDGLELNNDHADLLTWIISYYQDKGEEERALPYSKKLTEQLSDPMSASVPGISIEFE